ncbi:hypothetical protein FKM82_011834 [Ascaphus truei]
MLAIIYFGQCVCLGGVQQGLYLHYGNICILMILYVQHSQPKKYFLLSCLLVHVSILQHFSLREENE